MKMAVIVAVCKKCYQLSSFFFYTAQQIQIDKASMGV